MHTFLNILLKTGTWCWMSLIFIFKFVVYHSCSLSTHLNCNMIRKVAENSLKFCPPDLSILIYRLHNMVCVVYWLETSPGMVGIYQPYLMCLYSLMKHWWPAANTVVLIYFSELFHDWLTRLFVLELLWIRDNMLGDNSPHCMRISHFKQFLNNFKAIL